MVLACVMIVGSTGTLVILAAIAVLIESVRMVLMMTALMDLIAKIFAYYQQSEVVAEEHRVKVEECCLRNKQLLKSIV